MGADGEAPWDGQAMGELEVCGPWVASGYYQAPEHTDEWSRDGWFRTGDVATIDPQGFLNTWPDVSSPRPRARALAI